MKNKIKAALLAVLMTAGFVAVASPAEAATIRCATASPSKRSDGSYDLLVGSTNYPRYTGRPFSHRITLKGTDLTGGSYYRTYTYTGTPRSFHTPVLDKRYPYWVRAESWQSGTKCTTRSR